MIFVVLISISVIEIISTWLFIKTSIRLFPGRRNRACQPRARHAKVRSNRQRRRSRLRRRRRNVLRALQRTSPSFDGRAQRAAA
jgi:hypothetical protein